MSSIKIAPSILAADFSKLHEEVSEVVHAGCEYLHVDVMDGAFVPNITIGQPVVRALSTVSDLPLDVHLMIREPERHLRSFADAGADIITVHVEACVHLHRTIGEIHALGKRAGVALNPATPLESVRWVLEDLDLILLMSVNPGFGGQVFIPETLERLQRLREMLAAKSLTPEVEVDGGIDAETIGKVARAGATVFVAGTSVFGQKNRSQAIAALRKAVG